MDIKIYARFQFNSMKGCGKKSGKWYNSLKFSNFKGHYSGKTESIIPERELVLTLMDIKICAKFQFNSMKGCGKKSGKWYNSLKFSNFRGHYSAKTKSITPKCELVLTLMDIKIYARFQFTSTKGCGKKSRKWYNSSKFSKFKGHYSAKTESITPKCELVLTPPPPRGYKDICQVLIQ